MPPKKKSSLGRKTKNAKILAASKAKETSAESQERLDSERIRLAARRAKESPEERSKRVGAINEMQKKALKSLKTTKNALVISLISI